MGTKKHFVAVSVASLVLVGEANAAFLVGSVGFIPLSDAGTYSQNSVTLPNNNLVVVNQAGTGNLSPLTQFSSVTPYSQTISGLSSTPTTESIPSFFVFNAAGGRFVFNLSSLAETSYNPGSFATFRGTGTLIDTVSSDGYDPSPASFTLAYNTVGGLNNFNVTFNTVAIPEPATYGTLAGIGLLSFTLGSQLRRKHA